ncbi:MAG: DUF4294 domain-containing protein [Bacteroidetes bacterium]|nr:MAG: DUF4294 domain-containing protein [Bacteroidota bacterium]
MQSKWSFKLLLFFLCFGGEFFAQLEDTMPIRTQDLGEVVADKDYFKKYQRALRRVRRVYPLALYAAKELKTLEEEQNELKSGRKKKRLAKDLNKELKEDFQFVIRDLYIEEGKLLMKLIHRETGKTVWEIISGNRGKVRANMQGGMGKLWGQDLDIRYEPKGEDQIVEQVIQDIWNKRVYADLSVRKMDKTTYKKRQKEYRSRRKAARKKNRKKKEEK